jgi:triosephosphate isomerase
MRKPLIAGNWKMHMTSAEGCELAVKVAESCAGLVDREVLLAPSYIMMAEVARAVKNSSVIISSQNICWEEKGAFTGEISPVMVKDAGGTGAIVGHSERRQIFLETDELVNRRVKGALRFGLLTILCIGETLEQRDGGETNAVLERQVRRGLDGVSGEEMKNIVVAYEPVWAIGTGKTASKEQAQEVHSFLRKLIGEIYEKNIAEQTRILYGGSVKPTNVDELMAQPDIDGALVGGAALDAESFGRIINFEF